MFTTSLIQFFNPFDTYTHEISEKGNYTTKGGPFPVHTDEPIQKETFYRNGNIITKQEFDDKNYKFQTLKVSQLFPNKIFNQLDETEYTIERVWGTRHLALNNIKAAAYMTVAIAATAYFGQSYFKDLI